MQRCGVKTRNGGTCQAYPVHGRDRCRMHGGKQKRGATHHLTTTGRYSKDLPTRLAARYEEARTDPDLLNLNAEIQLTYALLTEALKGMDAGESGRLWRELKAAWEALQDANRAKDTHAAREALQDIGRLIARGVADHAARTEVLNIVDRRRKLVESEGKRRTAMQQMITAERITVLTTAVVEIVMRHVDDAGTRAAIGADIGALLSGGDRTGA